MKTTCTRKLKFDAAHRVMGHENKCANLHGHGYEVHITAQAEQLDQLGRVVDFSVLKERIGNWIDTYWDHTAILFDQDREAIAAVEGIQQNKKVFVADFNPTAENMAQYLLAKVCPEQLQGTGVQVTHVRVWETVNCYADAYLD